jgi:uncharacterized membrane protein YjgN (DUF898 family)
VAAAKGEAMHDQTMALDAGPIEPAASSPPRAHPERPFEFRGSPREYFRIWIVNLALSIATLGIYSAWASVRTRRYFYANTWLAGSPFEYSAQPLPILRGRLIAVLIFACYILASRVSPWAQLAAAGAVALVMPWLLVRGLAFRARYSSWRGLPFRFEPDFKSAYAWYLAAYLLMLPTAGFAYPWIKKRQQHWMVRHHRYGNAEFDFENKLSSYFEVLFATIGIVLLALLVLVVFAAIIGLASAGPHGLDLKGHPILVLLAVYAAYIPAYLAVYAYNRSRMLNLLYNGAILGGGHRLRSTLGFREMLWIYLSNLAAIVFTVGLAMPWAKVRMVRYRASNLCLEPAGDLDAFVAETQAQTDVGALGAEMDGFFSIDIGL